MKNEKKCVIEGCERKQSSKKHGLCSTHLMRYYRRGDPGDSEIVPKCTHEPYHADEDCK